MKKLVLIFALIYLGFAFGGTKGSKKLLTTHTAATLKSGEFALTSGMNFFTKAFDSAGGGVDAFNFWQIDGDLAISYGLMEDLDLTLASRFYQDTQSEGNNSPAYVSIDAKYGNIEVSGRSLLMAANLGINFGTGDEFNIAFEDYHSEGLTIYPEVVMSYFSDEYLPERAFSVHASLGIKMHFDNGNEFVSYSGYKYETLTSNTSSLSFSVGTKFPLEKIDILAEIDGYTFLGDPSEYLHGRETRIVNNIAFRYKFSSFLNFDFGFGYNIVTGDESTIVQSARTDDPLLSNESYSSWRGFLGVNVAFAGDGYSSASDRIEIERNEFKQKVQTFETLIKEQKNNELIQKELENLKKEREKAEKELEELKKILEDDK
jgi:hypothetical protein